MKIETKKLYHAHLNGAKNVMEHKQYLNSINVFPVPDGDTGNNLFSLMNTILRESELKDTFKKTFETISYAALTGARGNSGIIFAQYFNGLSMELSGDSTITLENYIHANNKAVNYAYESIEKPVEGTMLTVMRVWASTLVELFDPGTSLSEILTNAKVKLEEAVKNTQNQLIVLKKANVVDSGAKGFYYFISGLIDFLLSEKEVVELNDFDEGETIPAAYDKHEHDIHFRYCTEALVECSYDTCTELKSSLTSLGDSVIVAGGQRYSRIHIHTNDPKNVFKVIYEKGKIIEQKIDDMHFQNEIVENQKHKIAILTDSVADLPMEFVNEHQIHLLNLSILCEDVTFIDKLTIEPKDLLEYSKSRSFPTTSQPSPMQIENKLNYLLGYYEHILIITVSKALSGTYNAIAKTIEKNKFKNITLIDSKQNSGAQGLIVQKCALDLEQNLPLEQIVEHVNASVENSKILVCIKNLDHMIRSGRLSVFSGKIAKLVGMKPIITLDKEGKGTLGGVSFSFEASQKKVLRRMKTFKKQGRLSSYAVVHVNNEEEALGFSKRIEEAIGQSPSYITETSSVIAIGAGGGTVAVAYILTGNS